ncbi:ATP-binding cassette domain-containing protein [Aquincola tertiaricarbonis]|uniref:ATP-binding cassette domain-containing protein n=1 Tax=Aquincola tertiaricarbonis TaxID=391953 RepID=A0ABY4SH07_AQUTE|nr:ATP-binding cassette domain-containing protein [Aquincola tertiaricarbonis]URI11187.1 ATP-binding cassette domain-containing protein [Aquincola tertiaricarbonis]
MITLRNLTLRRGTKVVLDNASVTLNPGEKIGLVGRNGAGKSSLFALLTGRLGADAGDAEIPPRWRIGEVAQHMPETSDSATDFVLQGDIPLMEAQAALAAAETSDDGHAIADAHMAIEEAGGFDARSRAQALLLGLGFQVQQLDAPVNSFSGGWRMRLQLARALMCPADLMLLDEPTNHLDLDALVWLEGWLQRFSGTMIVISHDREFLDAITKVTLHLDEAKLTRYGGNYTTFEEMRAERMSQQATAFVKQQERIAHLQRFIDRFKAKASKAKQAQSRVKALDRMEKLAPVLTASDFSFEFKEPVSLPNPMLAMREVVCGYMVPSADDASVRVPKPIVHNVTRTVLAGQRIGILGANGQGKSTVVKTIAREHPALGGEITEGKGLAIGYFAQQEMDLLHADDAPLQHMVRLARTVGPEAREQELRDFLGKFRFTGDMVQQRIGSLSGGEKARLVLASLVWQRPNLLLLDEPTNHLDLTTREALSMALNEFEGSVMLVSHDRALLREVCDEFWLVTAGGLQPFDGDLDDYQRWLLEQSRAVQRAAAKGEKYNATPLPESPKPAAVAPAPAPAPAPAQQQGPGRREDRKAQAQARAKLAERTRPLRIEIERVDSRMAKLAAERGDCEAQLASGSLPGSEIAELGRKLNHISAEMTMLEERWLELSSEIEALQASAG